MNINEAQFLQKMFKYFDIQNRGKVDFDQFYRSMEKVGIIMEKSVSTDNRWSRVHFLALVRGAAIKEFLG